MCGEEVKNKEILSGEGREEGEREGEERRRRRRREKKRKTTHSHYAMPQSNRLLRIFSTYHNFAYKK